MTYPVPRAVESDIGDAIDRLEDQIERYKFHSKGEKRRLRRSHRRAYGLYRQGIVLRAALYGKKESSLHPYDLEREYEDAQGRLISESLIPHGSLFNVVNDLKHEEYIEVMDTGQEHRGTDKTIKNLTITRMGLLEVLSTDAYHLGEVGKSLDGSNDLAILYPTGSLFGPFPNAWTELDFIFGRYPQFLRPMKWALVRETKSENFARYALREMASSSAMPRGLLQRGGTVDLAETAVLASLIELFLVEHEREILSAIPMWFPSLLRESLGMDNRQLAILTNEAEAYLSRDEELARRFCDVVTSSVNALRRLDGIVASISQGKG